MNGHISRNLGTAMICIAIAPSIYRFTDTSPSSHLHPPPVNTLPAVHIWEQLQGMGAIGSCKEYSIRLRKSTSSFTYKRRSGLQQDRLYHLRVNLGAGEPLHSGPLVNIRSDPGLMLKESLPDIFVAYGNKVKHFSDWILLRWPR